jgi:hypothetical protein
MTWKAAIRSLSRPRKTVRRLSYLLWLASSEGPREAAYLKRFEPSPFVLAALRLHHAFSRYPPRCRDGNALFLVPPAAVKARAICRYARQYHLSIFVETGTAHGDTVAKVSGMFDRCITIELAEYLWLQGQSRFREIPSITCLHGDSRVVLPRVISELGAPALFWLDAHTSGGETANSGRDPVQDELDAIFSHPPLQHVVLIDDARGHHISDIIARIPPSHRAEVRNDMVRITPARPTIPR